MIIFQVLLYKAHSSQTSAVNEFRKFPCYHYICNVSTFSTSWLNIQCVLVELKQKILVQKGYTIIQIIKLLCMKLVVASITCLIEWQSWCKPAIDYSFDLCICNFFFKCLWTFLMKSSLEVRFYHLWFVAFEYDFGTIMWPWNSCLGS